MRAEQVEIYSDATNAAIMRHPGRRFPGVLVQGDSLCILCREADEACRKIGSGSAGYEAVNHIRKALWSYLIHYKQTLVEHDLALPFNEAG